MKAKILLILLGFILAHDQIPYYGLMLVSTKPSFARDMLYIVNTIVQNARYFTYSDISIADKNQSMMITKHVKDIEIEGVKFFPEEITSNLFYDKKEHKATLSTGKPIIEYLIKFKWSISILGITISYGEGTAIISSNFFIAGLTLPEKKLKGELDVKFIAKVEEIKGFGGSETLKQEINSALNSKTTEEVRNALLENTIFLEKYIFAPYQIIERYANENHVITYENIPTNSTELENNIWVSFTTELTLDGKEKTRINKPYYVEDSKGIRDVGLYISPAVAIATGDFYRILDLFDMYIDLKKLGYSGMIVDFFEAMPELSNRYDPRVEVNMTCEAILIDYGKEQNEVSVNFKCGLHALKEHEPFLLIGLTYKITIIPSKTEDRLQLFILKFEKANLEYFDVHPRSNDIVIFISELLRRMGEIVFKGYTWHIPRLRYEPLREYSSFYVPQRRNYYVAFYEI